jgi:glycosyltransferase involved in cell wall biosynthesis
MNPAAYLGHGQVFVLSSRLEGLPGALIQAMACGCALVATDCPSGPREVLDGGRYGHLVPVGDVEGMAQAICAALRGDERKPPRSYLARFEEETVLEQYLDLVRIGK